MRGVSPVALRAGCADDGVKSRLAWACAFEARGGCAHTSHRSAVLLCRDARKYFWVRGCEVGRVRGTWAVSTVVVMAASA